MSELKESYARVAARNLAAVAEGMQKQGALFDEEPRPALVEAT